MNFKVSTVLILLSFGFGLGLGIYISFSYQNQLGSIGAVGITISGLGTGILILKTLTDWYKETVLEFGEITVNNDIYFLEVTKKRAELTVWKGAFKLTEPYYLLSRQRLLYTPQTNTIQSNPIQCSSIQYYSAQSSIEIELN